MKAINWAGMMVCMMGCLGVAFVGAEEVTSGQTQAGGQGAQKQEKVHRAQYLNIEGTLKAIQGDMYVLEGASTDKPVRVHVGGDTAFPNGYKEPGQLVQALVIASTGHALIIR